MLEVCDEDLLLEDGGVVATGLGLLTSSVPVNEMLVLCLQVEVSMKGSRMVDRHLLFGWTFGAASGFGWSTAIKC